MRKFAENYNATTISNFIHIEAEFKKAPITQQVVAQLLLIENEGVIIVQQPAAQLENKPSLIVQQVAAQLEEGAFRKCIISKISRSHHMVLMDKDPTLASVFGICLTAWNTATAVTCWP